MVLDLRQARHQDCADRTGRVVGQPDWESTAVACVLWEWHSLDLRLAALHLEAERVQRQKNYTVEKRRELPDNHSQTAHQEGRLTGPLHDVFFAAHPVPVVGAWWQFGQYQRKCAIPLMTLRNSLTARSSPTTQLNSTCPSNIRIAITAPLPLSSPYCAMKRLRRAQPRSQAAKRVERISDVGYRAPHAH